MILHSHQDQVLVGLACCCGTATSSHRRGRKSFVLICRSRRIGWIYAPWRLIQPNNSFFRSLLGCWYFVLFNSETVKNHDPETCTQVLHVFKLKGVLLGHSKLESNCEVPLRQSATSKQPWFHFKHQMTITPSINSGTLRYSPSYNASA